MLTLFKMQCVVEDFIMTDDPETNRINRTIIYGGGVFTLILVLFLFSIL